MRVKRCADCAGEAFAIDGKRAACRHLILVRGLHDQRLAAAKLLVQEPDGVSLLVVGSEGVGTNQFSQPVGLVRFGAAQGPHFVKDDRDAAGGDLPRSLGTGETAANDVDGLVHGRGT